MITFNYETDFILDNQNSTVLWIQQILVKHTRTEGEINFIFCNDEYLHQLNMQFLQHDTYTDVISFDNSLGNLISGDIFISIDRVQDNAKRFTTTFYEELHRVMIHGVLHFIGFKDKNEDDILIMRQQEDAALSLLS